MKIALTGPGGGGKTTLMNALSQTDEFGALKQLPSVTRSIRERGFPINESGTEDTQLMIFLQHITNLMYEDDYLVDRCLLDAVVYTEALLTRDSWLYRFGTHLIVRYIEMYDMLIYVPNEFEVEADGVRSTDAEFQSTIRDLFDTYVTISPYIKDRVITVSGTVEERVQQVLHALTKKQKKELLYG